MKLDDYVKETLLSISRGVRAAQEDPDHGEHVGRVPVTSTQDLQGNTVTTVSFDLSTTSEDKGSVGGGISVVPFSAKAESSSGSRAANRIQFSLPLAIPKPQAQRNDDDARRQRESAAIRRRPPSDFG